MAGLRVPGHPAVFGAQILSCTFPAQRNIKHSPRITFPVSYLKDNSVQPPPCYPRPWLRAEQKDVGVTFQLTTLVFMAPVSPRFSPDATGFDLPECLQLPLLEQQAPARQSLPERLLVLLNEMNCLGFFPRLFLEFYCLTRSCWNLEKSN